MRKHDAANVAASTFQPFPFFFSSPLSSLLFFYCSTPRQLDRPSSYNLESPSTDCSPSLERLSNIFRTLRDFDSQRPRFASLRLFFFFLFNNDRRTWRDLAQAGFSMKSCLLLFQTREQCFSLLNTSRRKQLYITNEIRGCSLDNLAVGHRSDRSRLSKRVNV